MFLSKELLFQIETVLYSSLYTYLLISSKRHLLQFSSSQKYFWSLLRQSLIVTQAKRFVFYHSTFIIFSCLSFSNVLRGSYWNKTSIILHCYMLKLLVLSNFSTSNLAFITMDLNDVNYFEDYYVVNCGTNESEINFPVWFSEKSFNIW